MGTRADAARVKVWGYSKAPGLRIGASVRGNRDWSGSRRVGVHSILEDTGLNREKGFSRQAHSFLSFSFFFFQSELWPCPSTPRFLW